MRRRHDELSLAEQYVAAKCGVLKKSQYVTEKDEQGHWKGSHYEYHARPIGDVRRLLRYRKTHEKYQPLEEVYGRIVRDGKFESLEEFASLYGTFNQLRKNQGYLIVTFVEAEAAVEGKTDEQIQMMMLVEGLE